MMRALQIAFYAVGLVLTVALPPYLFLSIIGIMMGDCFPREGIVCPTDAERNLAIGTHLVLAVTFYAIAMFGLGRLYKRLF